MFDKSEKNSQKELPANLDLSGSDLNRLSGNELKTLFDNIARCPVHIDLANFNREAPAEATDLINRLSSIGRRDEGPAAGPGSSS